MALTCQPTERKWKGVTRLLSIRSLHASTIDSPTVCGQSVLYIGHRAYWYEMDAANAATTTATLIKNTKIAFWFFSVMSMFDPVFMVPWIMFCIAATNDDITVVGQMMFLCVGAMGVYVGAGREVLPAIALCAAVSFADEKIEKLFSNSLIKIKSRIMG